MDRQIERGRETDGHMEVDRQTDSCTCRHGQTAEETNRKKHGQIDEETFH